MSLTVVRTTSALPFFTTDVHSPTLVSCASFEDDSGASARLESIRDRGTCLDAARAAFQGSTFPTSIDVTQVNVGVHAHPCSGCFVFTALVETDQPSKVRYCDYDPSFQFDGLDDPNWTNDNVRYWPLCIGSVSPSPSWSLSS